jgi:hypothetical protein
MKISNLLRSELELLKNRIISGDFANECGDTEFSDVCQKDVAWYRWLCRHSLRRHCSLSWSIESPANHPESPSFRPFRTVQVAVKKLNDHRF